jgi:hypothetical protein
MFATDLVRQSSRFTRPLRRRRPAARPAPQRAFRPAVEELEHRLTPADFNLFGFNVNAGFDPTSGFTFSADNGTTSFGGNLNLTLPTLSFDPNAAGGLGLGLSATGFNFDTSGFLNSGDFNAAGGLSGGLDLGALLNGAGNGSASFNTSGLLNGFGNVNLGDFSLGGSLPDTTFGGNLNVNLPTVNFTPSFTDNGFNLGLTSNGFNFDASTFLNSGAFNFNNTLNGNLDFNASLASSGLGNIATSLGVNGALGGTGSIDFGGFGFNGLFGGALQENGSLGLTLPSGLDNLGSLSVSNSSSPSFDIGLGAFGGDTSLGGVFSANVPTPNFNFSLSPGQIQGGIDVSGGLGLGGFFNSPDTSFLGGIGGAQNFGANAQIDPNTLGFGLSGFFNNGSGLDFGTGGGTSGSFFNGQSLNGDLNGFFNPDFTDTGSFDFSSLAPSLSGGDLSGSFGQDFSFSSPDFSGDF